MLAKKTYKQKQIKQQTNLRKKKETNKNEKKKENEQTKYILKWKDIFKYAYSLVISDSDWLYTCVVLYLPSVGFKSLNKTCQRNRKYTHHQYMMCWRTQSMSRWDPNKMSIKMLFMIKVELSKNTLWSLY